MPRKFLIPFLFCIVLIAGLLVAGEIRKTVTIISGDHEYLVTFWGFRVTDALAAAGIPVYEDDVITPQLEDGVNDGDLVKIERAYWAVIVADQQTRSIWTTQRNPWILLADLDIQLKPGDKLSVNGEFIPADKPLPYKTSYTIQVQRSTRISLDYDGLKQTIQSNARSLGEALSSEAGIQLYEADVLKPLPDTPLVGKEINATLERSKEVTIQRMNHVVKTRVLAETTGEALSAAGMPLQGMDYSIPRENKPIPPDGHIQVIQVREEVIVEQEPLPFGLEYQPLPEVDLDIQQVVQVGEYGVLARRVRVIFEDDQEISREVGTEWIAKQPKSRIVGYGTRANIRTVDTADGPIEYYRSVEAYATSYSPCRIGTGQCSNRTASGATLRKGVIGVIRSWYNYMKGAAVYIPGYGFATIEDIGAGFSDRHWVDLGYADDDWVNWHGYVTVYFLTPVPDNVLYILN